MVRSVRTNEKKEEKKNENEQEIRDIIDYKRWYGTSVYAKHGFVELATAEFEEKK